MVLHAFHRRIRGINSTQLPPFPKWSRCATLRHAVLTKYELQYKLFSCIQIWHQLSNWAFMYCWTHYIIVGERTCTNSSLSAHQGSRGRSAPWSWLYTSLSSIRLYFEIVIPWRYTILQKEIWAVLFRQPICGKISRRSRRCFQVTEKYLRTQILSPKSQEIRDS